MAAGERFDYDQEGMKKLLAHMQTINETFWSIMFSPLTFMPFLKNYWPMKEKVEMAKKKMSGLREFYQETIEKHQKTFDPENIRDVIDAFLLEMQNSKDLDPKQLTVVLSDLFLAGSETTGKSLEWACLFMIKYPEVRKKHIPLESEKRVQLGAKILC